MYALKIENGKERIRVRSYASAFIPSYTSAAEDSMGKRMYVVPGYIFMMTKAPGAEKVPDSEWKVIEAISDSHPSTFNTKTKQITDGPLKGLLIEAIIQECGHETFLPQREGGCVADLPDEINGLPKRK